MIIIRNIEPEDLAMVLVDMAERYAAHRRRRAECRKKRQEATRSTPGPAQNHGCNNKAETCPF